MKETQYLTDLKRVGEVGAREQTDLEAVSEKFAFRSNDYYQGLIDWSDPGDPIRQIIIPKKEELENWGLLDASNEESWTVVPGLEHKYTDTALLLVNDVCGGYCRFCFRKRLFMDDNNEVVRDISEGLRYIREHQEITNVLLTGGDPLVMSNGRLQKILSLLREIEHVKIIRIGTKMPAFNPARILNDADLLKLIEKCSSPERRIYIIAHFNHSRELTSHAVKSMSLLIGAGAVALNQTPIIRGVNDDPEVLVELFNELSFIGVPPYYVFQCRPTLGNKPYSVPLEEAYGIFIQAQSRCSGLAKRARFVMSHSTGKIEVVGLAEGNIYMRYHQAVDSANYTRFLNFKRNPEAHWLDEYEEMQELNRRAAK